MKSLGAIVILFFCQLVFAQSNQVSGRLVEDGTDIPLIGATIKVKDWKVGTTTDAQGNFTIELPNGEYELEISSVGYATTVHRLQVPASSPIAISVKEALTALPEFVVETTTLSAGRQGLKSIPGSVHYIDTKELQKLNYSNVNDVMKQVPGVNIQEEDGFGLRPNIGLRGSGLERSSKITLMEDGILAAPAPYAAPSAYYFPTMGRMSGVEVLKGSSQVRFGPFTTGGAINFLSTPIPTSQSAFVGFTAGSFGYLSTQAYFGDRKERFGYIIEGFQYGANGFKSVPNGETGFLKNDLNAKFSVNTAPKRNIYQSLTFNIGWTKEDADETYLGLTQEDFNADPFQRYAASQVDNMDAEQNRFSVQHYIEIPGVFNIVTTAYRNDFKRNWYRLQSAGGESLSNILDDPTTYAAQYDLLTGVADTESGDLVVRANNRKYYSQGVQTTLDFEFETGKWSHDIHVSTRIHQDQEDRFQDQDAYGIENGVMQLVSKGAPGSNANRVEEASAVSSYVFYKLDYGKLSFTPGIRQELLTISRENFGNADPGRTKNADYSTRSNFFSAILPGMGINYSLNKQTTVFAGVHKGFAPGNSQEGSRSESSINYEIGTRKSGRNLSGSVVVFVNDYQNLLGADNASVGGTGTGELFNAGEAMTKGLELEATYNVLANSSNFSLPVSIAYTYTDARFGNTFDSSFEGWGSVTKGDQVPYLARNQWFVSATLRAKNYSITLNGKYQSSVRTVPGSGEIAKSEKIAAFFTSDVSLNYFIDSRTTFFTSVTNIADAEYAVARRPAGLRPGMPRAFRVGMNVRF